jgi:hypothetical protein
MVDKKDLKSFELKARVGSSPTSGTLDKLGGLAQLARAPALHAGGRGFESLILHFVMIRKRMTEQTLRMKWKLLKLVQRSG